MENVNPEKVVEILKQHDMQISMEEAVLILAFMQKLAKIVINQKEKES
ncbi:hypothetical protein [Ferruginibacter sp.]